MRNGKVIAIANQKGGVGKTTTTAFLGAGLVRMGYKTLLIDLDAQASLTLGLGFQNLDELPVTIGHLMGMVIDDEPLKLEESILRHSSGVSLIPANITLSGMESLLVNTMSREHVLRCIISDLRPEYDYILIDCAPSLGMLSINAWAAANSVLVPVQAHFFSVAGIELLLKNIKMVRRQINPSLSIEGIVLTMLDTRSNFTRDMVSSLRSIYGGNFKVFDAMIPNTVRAIEAVAKGISIYDHEPENAAAQAYLALTKEVIANYGREKGQNRHDRNAQEPSR